MENDQQLQELYRHLDHYANGNMYIAWYGQLRAKELSHQEALAKTIEHFGLSSKEWYIKRFPTTTNEE